MKVLMVTSEWPSDERPDAVPFIVQQVEFLRRTGIEADVFSFRGAGDPRNYLHARRQVRARARASRYDLVHSHFGQAGIAAGGVDLPSVVTFYGSDLEGIVGTSGRYTFGGKVLSAASRHVARRSDSVILVSRSMARHLPRGIGFDVVPLGVDREVFKPRPAEPARLELGLPMDNALVLFSGRPGVPVKRYDLARRAVEMVAPRSSPQLVVVQSQPRDVVARYMNACDCLLVTSRHEGAPTMVKEALASGLRVVSVDVGDIREWIEPLPGSVLVMDDSPASIAAGVEAALAAGPVDYRAVAEQVDERAFVDRIIAVYTRVLDRADRAA